MKEIIRILKNRWAEYLIEIIVIIIGISLTLLFNNWRENIIHNKEETKLLQSIRENLVADTVLLDNHLKNLHIMLDGHRKMLSENIDTFPNDSLAFFLDLTATYNNFHHIDIGYEELKLHKGSMIITNRVLLQKIIQHYEQKFDIINEWNDVDKNFVLNDMLPFLSQHMQYSDSPILFDDATTTRQLLKNDDYFKNMVKSGKVYKQIIHMFYVRLKNETKVLIQAIDQELS